MSCLVPNLKTEGLATILNIHISKCYNISMIDEN